MEYLNIYSAGISIGHYRTIYKLYLLNFWYFFTCFFTGIRGRNDFASFRSSSPGGGKPVGLQHGISMLDEGSTCWAQDGQDATDSMWIYWIYWIYCCFAVPLKLCLMDLDGTSCTSSSGYVVRAIEKKHRSTVTGDSAPSPEAPEQTGHEKHEKPCPGLEIHYFEMDQNHSKPTKT